MIPIAIAPDVYWIGVNDRTTELFEGLWPISREGISYNAYLLNDQKKALIDLTKSFNTDEFFHQVDSLTDITQLDYIVINHMEPDHSGALSTLKRIEGRPTLLGTKKTVEMLESFYGIREKVRPVQDGETLSLGRRTLQFVHTPFVHWPETMMTYESSHGILFPCDGFGGYGALQGGIFDDQCGNIDFYLKEALRYYVNVLALFSKMVLKAIDRLKQLPIKIVAPSHGIIWRKEPQRMVNLYREWAGYATGTAEQGVTLIYGTMYGNTESMANAIAQGISRAGTPVEVFDVARTHPSYLLPSLWTNEGVIIGAPTYEGTLFPPVAQAVDIAVHKGVRNKKAGWFGSYGWSGGAQREFQKIVENAKWDLIDSLEIKGGPTSADLNEGEQFGERIAKALRGE
ncbi:MAG: FprA family A-type flavoprotein [Thermodesulfobacteriota bacterium]